MKKLILAISTMAFILGGCGNGSSEKNVSDTTGKEKLVVGMECTYAPYSWTTTKQSDSSVALDGTNFCDGYDVLIARKLADELDREIVVKKISWEGLQPALEEGDIDLIVAGMGPDDEQGAIDFTDSYYESDLVMVAKKGSEVAGFKDIQQFSGRKVLGQKGTVYDYAIDEISKVNHVEPKATYPEVVTALKNGEVDAIVADAAVANSVVKNNSEFVIVKFDEGKGFEANGDVYIGMKKGSKDGDLFKGIQAVLNKITPEMKKEMMDKATAAQPTN